MPSNYVSGGSLLTEWMANIEHGEPLMRFAVGEPFNSIDARPGRLILLGGPPGAGKTAALLQIGVDLLRLNPTARLMIANVEMAPRLLVDRIFSRLSGVPLARLGDHALTADEREQLQVAFAAVQTDFKRIAFMKEPYSLEHLASAATEFEANVLIADYVQRFSVGDSSRDNREQLEAVSSTLRRFCDQGVAVLAAAAVSRQRSAGGSSYRNLNLASFRGSSELEYGADSAYIAVPGDYGGIIFKCEKNRYGPVTDIPTRFQPEIQTFTSATAGNVDLVGIANLVAEPGFDNWTAEDEP